MNHRVELSRRAASYLRRARVGNLRILFYVDDEVRVVDVTEIGPRGDIYQA